MENFPSAEGGEQSRTHSGMGFAIFTLIALLPLFFLSVPAIVFSYKAKKLYSSHNHAEALNCKNKSRRLANSAWAICFILILTSIALLVISHLSLI